MLKLYRFICSIFLVFMSIVSTAEPGAANSRGELITTKLSEADIKWLRALEVRWEGCEAGAPAIEPASTGLFSTGPDRKLAKLLPVYFLHAQFAAGTYDIGEAQPFTVTQDHIKLMKVLSWERAEVDCKRPYGDFTNFTIDMAKALGVPVTAGADRIARIAPEEEERLGALHLEMLKVVKAYIRHGKLAPGTYQLPRGGFEPEGAPRPRLTPPTKNDFAKFLKDIAAARKEKESWHVFSVVAGLYSAP